MRLDETIDSQVAVLDTVQVERIMSGPGNAHDAGRGLLHRFLIAFSPMYKNYEAQIQDNEIRKEKIRLAANVFQNELMRRANVSLSVIEQNGRQFEAEIRKISEVLADIRNNRKLRHESIRTLHGVIRRSESSEERLIAMRVLQALHGESSEELKGAFKAINDSGERQVMHLEKTGSMLLSNKMEGIQKCLEQ